MIGFVGSTTTLPLRSPACTTRSVSASSHTASTTVSASAIAWFTDAELVSGPELVRNGDRVSVISCRQHDPLVTADQMLSQRAP